MHVCVTDCDAVCVSLGVAVTVTLDVSVSERVCDWLFEPDSVSVGLVVVERVCDTLAVPVADPVAEPLGVAPGDCDCVSLGVVDAVEVDVTV